VVTPILEGLDLCHPHQHAHAGATLTPRSSQKSLLCRGSGYAPLTLTSMYVVPMGNKRRDTAYKVRRALPPGLRRVMARGGLFLGGDQTFPSTLASLNLLRAKGFVPRFAVDGGAYVGDWTELFRSVFPTTKMLMVEPQADKQPVLRAKIDERTRLSDALLGPEEGAEVEFFEMETGSSVLSELTDVPRRRILKQVRTLDRLLADQPAGWNIPDFLKLDVQGFELEVLSGGSESLQSTQFVLLEVSLIPYNLGAPLLPDVLQFMWAKGFTLMDFCTQMRREDGFLRQTDLLFVNGSSEFLPH